MKGRSIAGAITLLIAMTAVWAVPSEAGVWTSRTFMDRREGTLPDAGSNIYVDSTGAIRLINLWDTNNDGHPDVVFANTHEHNEKLPLSIYYGLDPTRRVQLPTEGGKGAVAADLNNDGWPDLVVASSFDGTKTELNSFIYWGNAKGFSPDRRASLPTQGAEAVAAADINGDGFTDLVFANSGLTYHVSVDAFRQSFVYWGGQDGFSTKHRTSLETTNAKDVAIADLNGDRIPDVVFAMEGNDAATGGAVVYSGPDLKKSQKLPGEHSTGIAVADLDRDGYPDLALSNGYRLRARELGMYNIVDTEAIDSVLYFGSTTGFTADRRVTLPTFGARGVDTADLNRDGYIDVVFANQSGGASFIYWNSPGGFSRNGRTALPTQRAQRCRIADFDSDGLPDIAFANMSDGQTYNTDSWIYRNSADGFSAKNRIALPSSGATGLAAADFDRDGKLDLVLVNKMDGLDGGTLDSFVYSSDSKGHFSPDRLIRLPAANVNAYSLADLNADGQPDVYFGGNTPTIYWNSPAGLSPSNRTVISGKHTFSGRMADFNRDGYVDIAASEWDPGGDQVSLWYGGPSGFSPASRTVLHVPGVRFNAAADLNNDGWLDLIYPSTANKTVIFWNGPEGFRQEKRLELATDVAISAEVADLNKDGFLDLIVCNLWSEKAPASGPKTFGGTAEAGLQIFWGGADGIRQDRMKHLRGVGTEDVAVADLNGDSWLDLVVSSYHAGTTRAHPSYIFWNGPAGLDEKRVTMLETNSASGILVTDFDGDGHKDILVACHSKDGNHRNDSYLYWGHNGKFSPDRRTLLPGLGPHLMTGIDPGGIRDRSDNFEYISPAFDAGKAVQFERVEWQADTPFATAVEIQIRTAASREALASASWSKKLTQPGALTGATGRWTQYRATLVSPNGANTPVLRDVRIHFR